MSRSMVKPGRAMPESLGLRVRIILSRTATFCTSGSQPDTSSYSLFAWSPPTILADIELYSAECASYVLTRISHTFCDTGAVRSEKVSRCKSLTATGQADPFRQSVFQPSAGRLMDIGEPPQPASVFRAKCSRLCRCEKCGLTKARQH